MSLRGLFKGSGGGASASPVGAGVATSGGSFVVPNAQHESRGGGGGRQFPELEPDHSGLGSGAFDEQGRLAQRRDETSQRRSAQDVLNELDERYMLESFDPVRELLLSLPEEDTPLNLESRADELQLVAATMDKKLTQQVSNNYPHFVSGMEMIQGVSKSLVSTRQLCVSGRAQLQTVGDQLGKAIMRTVQKQRRLARVRTVILGLMQVYSLLRAENEIHSLLGQGEFTRAVSAYKACLLQLAQSNLEKFTCLDALRARFLRTAEMIGSRVKERLLRLCQRADADATRNLLHAMVSLGDAQLLEQHLRRLLPQAAEDSAAEAVTPFLQREYLLRADCGEP